MTRSGRCQNAQFRFSVLWENEQMKKPFMRVTKWLGDIPVEARCTSCPATMFKAQGSGHRTNREEYKKSLEAQFEAHMANVHKSENHNTTEN